jgi:alkylhydroperoxidase family enzyme
VQYASQEDIFNKLLLTPDLDKRLKAGDQELQQAVHVVESAVASAVQLAFHSNNSSSASNSNSASESNSRASSPEGEFGCIALNSDEQCMVDWTSESMWNNAAAAGALGAHPDPGSHASFDTHAGREGGQVSARVDGLARAAVALDSATGESFDVASAHTFLQRLLYKINRLNHFW